MNKTVIFNGMGDASAAVALDENNFLVANDEDNILRVFDRNKPDSLQKLRLSEIFDGEISDKKKQEIDIEGAAELGDKIFWTGSHGTNNEAEPRPARHRLFAIRIKRGDDGEYKPSRAGQIYTSLIADLEKDSRFDAYNLKQAKTIKPKDIGGLSIEGLSATPDGALLIGFRNPLGGGQTLDGFLVGGKALIVKLLNPVEVINGQAAKFDAPIELDLDGFGIRSLEYYKPKNMYLIVAGTYHDNKKTPTHQPEASRLYIWSGKAFDTPELLENVDLAAFNIESVFVFPQMKNSIVLLSDDGSDDGNKSFRGILIKLE
jgi:hypothetical protein